MEQPVHKQEGSEIDAKSFTFPVPKLEIHVPRSMSKLPEVAALMNSTFRILQGLEDELVSCNGAGL